MPRPKNDHAGQIGDFWLSQRPNSPVWCRTWFDPATRQTRRASLGTTDLREAQLKLAEWITCHQILRSEAPENVPLETVLVRYYEGHGKRIPSRDQARISLSLWSTFFARATVDDVTPDRIDSFIGWLRDQGHSNGYINRTLSVGKAALNRAFKRQEVYRVPYVPQLPPGDPRERRLSMEESAALLDACTSEHLFMFVLLAFNTLSRPQALLDLRRDQIDLENRLIHLNPPGRHQTKKYRPVVPISATLVPWLKEGSGDYVVNYHDRRVASIKKAFRELRKKAGLDPTVTPYTIRHTMATELRRRGVPPWEVAGMLGHKSAGYRTTEIYAKFDPDFLGKAIAAIDAYFAELDGFTSRSLLQPSSTLRASCVLEEGLA